MAVAPAPYMFVRGDWLARHREDILEPALPIIDPAATDLFSHTAARFYRLKL